MREETGEPRTAIFGDVAVVPVSGELDLTLCVKLAPEPNAAMHELARQLEADRDPDQHAQAGLLGQHRSHRAEALAGVVVSGRFPDRPPVRAVVIDLEAVSLVDSSGIALLVDAFLRLQQSGRQLAIACPMGSQRRAFEVTALDRQLPMHETREAALAAVGAAEGQKAGTGDL